MEMLLQNPLNIRTVDVVQVVFLIIQTAALILAYYFIFLCYIHMSLFAHHYHICRGKWVGFF